MATSSTDDGSWSRWRLGRGQPLHPRPSRIRLNGTRCLSPLCSSFGLPSPCIAALVLIDERTIKPFRWHFVAFGDLHDGFSPILHTPLDHGLGGGRAAGCL